MKSQKNAHEHRRPRWSEQSQALSDLINDVPCWPRAGIAIRRGNQKRRRLSGDQLKQRWRAKDTLVTTAPITSEATPAQGE